MAVDEHRRVVLFEQLATAIGREATSTLFELLPGSGKTAATGDDVDRLGRDLQAEFATLGGQLRGEMAELRSDLHGEMAELRSDLHGEMAELRSDLRGEMAELRTGMGELRSELREQRSDLMAAFRAELNEALTRNTRTMLLGLVGTLLSTIGLAAVLARFVV